MQQPVSALLVFLLFAGCAQINRAVSDVAEVAPAALNLAGSAVALQNAVGNSGSGGGALPPTAMRNSATVVTGQGYSQRGAFDDCAAVYGAAGMEALKRQCVARANSMNSIR